jgi:hypothetical protein
VVLLLLQGRFLDLMESQSLFVLALRAFATLKEVKKDLV